MQYISPWQRRHLAWVLAAAALACSGWLALSGTAAAGTAHPGAAGAAHPGAAGAAQEQVFEALDAYLRDRVEALALPGAAVVVVREGRQVHGAAFGRADDSGRPMTVQTPVLLASTSKALTAIAVLQQVEAGLLELDEPVSTYLPWFTVEGKGAGPLTVRHLLHQTSGLSTADGTTFAASDTQAPGAIEQGVRELSGTRLADAPGSSFAYSNANYNVLGLLVQTVSGQPFAEYLVDHVFTPLGMRHSHPTRSAARADNLAAGYSLWFGAWWRPTEVPAPTTAMPSISLYASAEDIGRELTALLGGGTSPHGRVLRTESVAMLLKPEVRIDDTRVYAMGWFARPLAESADPAAGAGSVLPLLLEHQGEWGNTHTYQAMVPASGLGVVLLINGSDSSAPSRLKAMDSDVLRILHGQAPQPAAIREDSLQRYGWTLAVALLLAELASLALALTLLRGRPRRRRLILVAVVALALDGLLVWLCLVHAPARFETQLAAIVRQMPDIGLFLVPALALAVGWSVPRTLLLLAAAAGSAPQRAGSQSPGQPEPTSPCS